MLCSTQSLRVKPAILRRSGRLVGKVRVRTPSCLCTQHNTTPVTPSFKYPYNKVTKPYYVMGDNMYAKGAPNEQTHTKTERKLDGLSGATKMADLLHRGVLVEA